jgi:hypothetical protein
MEQIKIYHEAPLSIFDDVRKLTDGDYALVHLLDSDERYAAEFMESKSLDRHIILDNSAYELGESFDPKVYARWVEVLDPDVYLVPDVPGHMQQTLTYFSDWMDKYSFNGKVMGVVQGTTVEEVIFCFKELQALGADIIGIPFLIGKRLWLPDSRLNGTLLSLMYLRAQLIEIIEQECVQHPIHLLGVALPQEGVFYRNNDWVVSVDSSNPVMHGLFGSRYHFGGINEKRPELLADNIHAGVSTEQRLTILHNIFDFRTMWAR